MTQFTPSASRSGHAEADAIRPDAVSPRGPAEQLGNAPLKDRARRAELVAAVPVGSATGRDAISGTRGSDAAVRRS